MPWEELLACIASNGEAEVVVNPTQLGEVTEVPRRAWRAEFPQPITVWLSETTVTVVPDVAH